MRCLGIIPARMGSSRFPGKPLALISGRPILFRVWDAVNSTRKLWPNFVATSDNEIIEACLREKVPCIVTKKGCRTGTERVIDAMRQPSYQEGDVVISVQGDEPLIRPESLDLLASEFNRFKETQIASLYCRPIRPANAANQNRVKVFVKNGFAHSFMRLVSDPALFPIYGEHIGAYGFKRHLLQAIGEIPPDTDLEQTAWMRARHRIRMVETPYAADPVDRPEDIPHVEAILRRRRV